MIVQPDLLVRDAMVEAFQAVNANPDLLIHEVFPGRPDAEQQIISEYFTSTVVQVALGFPLQSGEVPGCYISIQQAPEDAQVVGSDFEDLYDTPNAEHITEVLGTYFRGTVRASCWAVQADAAMYVQNVALWGLLRFRPSLEEAGLKEQRIALTDFDPVPEWFPDVAFRREVLLTSLYPVSVQEAFLKIRTVQVTGREANPRSDAEMRVYVASNGRIGRKE